MGNVAVLKLPAIGGLVHALTARAFAASLPPGVINFVSGPGRETMGTRIGWLERQKQHCKKNSKTQLQLKIPSDH